MSEGTGLAGRTLFITGASRGIGLEIGLMAAREGANVAIAAKTAEPHPKLPGTIHTAAAEIEKAGGQALAIQTDIRDDAQVEAAVDAAVERFGGIDILINNASAISLTGTLETPMKRVDLMLGVNLRGTYTTSRACLPHLLKADNPHILTLSPPLNLDPGWFGPHTAYTIAKYGMSLCALGMAEEFKGHVAVNALWPRTVINTAALAMLPHVDPKRTRQPRILADAARWILTQDARTLTGAFFIDEEALARAGVTDLDQYAVDPGQDLLTDIFLGDPAEHRIA